MSQQRKVSCTRKEEPVRETDGTVCLCGARDVKLSLTDRDRAARSSSCILDFWCKLNSPLNYLLLVVTLFIYNNFASSELVAAFIGCVLRYYHYHLDHYSYAGVSQFL